MIVRLLLLAALFYIVYAWLRRAATTARAPGPAASQENMVTCAHCGVYLPQSESLSAGGRSYCSDEHRLAAHP
jgi:uncharacterized protein